jgi:hypothetical protein
MKQATVQQPLLGNGSANRYEPTIALQQKSDVFYAVCAEML